MRSKEQERDYKRYAASQMASEFLDGSFKMMQFTPEQRRYFCRHPHEYRYGDPDKQHKPHFSHFTSNNFNNRVYNSLIGALEEVQSCRQRLRDVDNRSVFAQAKQASEVQLRSYIDATFPKLRVDAVVAKKRVDEYIETKQTSYYGVSYNISVALTWARSVWEKDIAKVADGKQDHIILKATERKLDRLHAEDIRAYKCLSMTGRSGKPELHDTWVMSWKTDTTHITSIHDEFSKAEALLRRRIKKQVTDILLDI